MCPKRFHHQPACTLDGARARTRAHPPAVRQLNLASLNRYGSLGVTYAAQWERPGVRIRDIHGMYRVEYEDARGTIMLQALELVFLFVSHVLLFSSLLPIYTPTSPWFGT